MDLSIRLLNHKFKYICELKDLDLYYLNPKYNHYIKIIIKNSINYVHINIAVSFFICNNNLDLTEILYKNNRLVYIIKLNFDKLSHSVEYYNLFQNRK